MLIFLLKTRQKRLCRIHERGQRHRKHVRLQLPTRRLQGMLLTANGGNIMETQKQSAIDSPFSACGEYIEWGTACAERRACGEV